MVQPSQPLTEDQIHAISVLVGHRRLSKMRYLNAHCIVGRAPEQLGIKVTRRLITLAKYQKRPVIQVPVDAVLRACLFGESGLLTNCFVGVGIDIEV